MKVDKLIDAIGMIDDEYIEKAHEKRKAFSFNKATIMKLAAAAVCVLLAVTILPRMFEYKGMGGSSNSAAYIGEDNQEHVPVMIHRAMLGSLERFIGILTEEYAGAFPTWLSPVQVAVMNITDDQVDYAKQVFEKLDEVGIRAKTDLRNDKIGFKIREHTLMHVPYLVVCGAREAEEGKVAVRTRKGADLGTMSLEDLIKLVKSDIIQRKNMPEADVAIEKARAEAEAKKD